MMPSRETAWKALQALGLDEDHQLVPEAVCVSAPHLLPVCVHLCLASAC